MNNECQFLIRYKLFCLPLTWIWGNGRIIFDGDKIWFDTGNMQGVVFGITKKRGLCVNGVLTSIDVSDTTCTYKAKGKVFSIEVVVDTSIRIKEINSKIFKRNANLVPNNR